MWEDFSLSLEMTNYHEICPVENCGYRVDLLVNDELVVELLLNFNRPTLKQGIKRLVLGLKG